MQAVPTSSRAHQQIYSLCIYCKGIRLSRMILCLLIVMVTIPLVSHYYLSSFYQDASSDHAEHHSRTKLEHSDDDDDDMGEARHSQLNSHVDELKRIKASVNNELRDLENKRQKLQSELSVYTSHVTSLKTEFDHLTRANNQLKVSIEQATVQYDELARKHMPIIIAPALLVPGLEQTNIPLDMPSSAESSQCRMHTSFDYSHCSLLSGFPVYFYTPSDLAISQSSVILEQFIENSVTHAFHSSVYITHDASVACVYVVLVGEVLAGNSLNKQTLELMLHELPYWRGDGRNHILLNLHRNPGALNHGDMFQDVNTGRSILAQSAFSQASFRPNFDVVIPPSLGKSDGDVWKGLPPLSPVRRMYMLSFVGEYHAGRGQSSPVNVNVQGHDSDQQQRSSSSATPSLSGDVIAVLKSMQTLSPDQFMFSFSCDTKDERVQSVHETDWTLCGSDSSREHLLKQSTFSLIIAPSNFSLVSTSLMLTRLYEALKFGSIPIILGDHVQLPFSESLQWKKALIIIPMPRVTEMHFYLSTVIDMDIADLRRHGRIIWETFFGSTRKIIDTLLLTVRRRLGIPAAAMHDEPQISIFNETFKQNTQIVSQIDAEMGDEILGPLEPAFASPRFHHNFTSVYLTDQLLRPGDPFHMYPSMPFEPLLPSEAKFLGSGFGFRPVNQGEGGSGKEFAESLGGNIAREQFTIVLLTYKREAVLMNALQRLKGLPYLNRVLVVWNSPDSPYPELRWPEIGVPVDIVKTQKNSLNNRFLPYERIETDAILSLDDDAHLRHDEIIFGFRVWRQERDNIVGFPARYHAWDLTHHTWLYNSNYSCELSMVLTGAAFFHKYYAYLYSYVMPQAIRDKVDEYLNCEDIALNFLVAHITRKPPIKVTSRWTFRCPGCEEALSSDDSHFQERHKCISFFVQVYGYMPLLYTQYRVDSVLFKTRISHDKQKCFKFI